MPHRCVARIVPTRNVADGGHRKGSAVFTPQTYGLALFLMTLSMLCWGTWADTQKITRRWPFELYYFDYTLGLLLYSRTVGLRLGQMAPTSPPTFFLNLRAASQRSLLLAFGGGAVFSVGNILI